MTYYYVYLNPSINMTHEHNMDIQKPLMLFYKEKTITHFAKYSYLEFRMKGRIQKSDDSK
jgi:hypothetical protein